jgi:hypothetical protein
MFSKRIEIMKKSRNVRNENLMNQIKNRVDGIISRQGQAEERISELEDKIKVILHTDNHKGRKLNVNDCNVQEPLNRIKRP